MKRFSTGFTTLLLAAIAVSTKAAGQDLKPLSAEDKATVDSLLSAFDPNSYNLRYIYTDREGRVLKAGAGSATGLASLRQSNTLRRSPGTAASTNTNINLFRQASTNTNINLFRQASTNTNINLFKPSAASTNTNINLFRSYAAQTNTNINIFKQSELEDRAVKLNAILDKYSR